ncbi:exodeoxyribonuclease VII small subunit [Fonticella tunisiensis]|uniref:Exodeoxyribonuclease 7 small subunit n=1 Tax=Fonticella tunisiensis TaxID=1096341 RepID=A0A4V3ETI1_9CLOT|nr:exodeoxyribonuclease VII small subunit [Fonticella tunisiensis]TDT61939.1 exodeoxyribonuclease VII small subunit [Fonticella tunisiensis]
MATRKKNMKFEEAIQRLEEIVNVIEDDSLSLEESIKIFQEGMELAAICNKKLDEAERRISVIMKGENNNLTEEDFIPEEE